MVPNIYNFIIKKLAKKFKEQFECLVENTEKHINFSVPIKKKVKRISTKVEEIKPKAMPYKMIYFDSLMFISSSL